MNSGNTTKRKKRKTRKYLNEIRKKSRNGNQCLTKDHGECSAETLKGSNQNKFLTMNRLTLSMFPRAVRSETITRPVLAKITHEKNLNLNDIVRDKKTLTASNNNIDVEPSSILQEVEHDHDRLLSEDDECPGSNVLQSPIYQENDNEISFSNKIETNPIESSSQEKANYLKLYDELMESLSQSLTIHVRKSYKRDMLQELREDLNKSMNLNDESSSSEQNSLNVALTSKDNDIERVIQNPIEYIRLAQTKLCDTADSKNNSDSPESNSCILSPSLFKSTPILQDTPEYNYYPHKLNQ